MNAMEIDNQYETTENTCVTTMRSQQLSPATPPPEELRQTGGNVAVALVNAGPANPWKTVGSATATAVTREEACLNFYFRGGDDEHIFEAGEPQVRRRRRAVGRVPKAGCWLGP